jgi:hypothetical protein
MGDTGQDKGDTYRSGIASYTVAMSMPPSCNMKMEDVIHVSITFKPGKGIIEKR